MFLSKGKCAFAAFTALLLLSSCAPYRAGVDERSASTILKNDLNTIYHENEKENLLTLEQAIARGLKYNLDSKVAEMEELLANDDLSLERLTMLPIINARTQSIGRSNPGASRSLSILSGMTSLEPSISTEQWRSVSTIDLNWNLLDIALGVARSRSSADRVMVATERRRKIFHNVVQDTYSSYWRAAAAQKAKPLIASLIADINVEIEKIDKSTKAGIVGLGDAKTLKAGFLDKRRSLLQLQDQMLLSEIELKTLIGLPPKAEVKLAVEPAWLEASSLPKTSQNLESLEKISLLNRPEVHEEFLNRSIALRNIRSSIFETFPGAEIALAYNNDTNQFLTDQEWGSTTLSLVQSITKILTLPARYKRAKDEKGLGEKRRQALVAAVITQVHVAQKRFAFYKGYYDSAIETDDNAKTMATRARHYAKVGMMSKAELANTKADAGLAEINRLLAYTQAQEAYGLLLNTLGLDVWGNATDLEAPGLADELKKNLSALEKAIVEEKAPLEEETEEAPT